MFAEGIPTLLLCLVGKKTRDINRRTTTMGLKYFVEYVIFFQERACFYLCFMYFMVGDIYLCSLEFYLYYSFLDYKRAS